MPRRMPHIVVFLLLAALFFGIPGRLRANDQPPNIVVILADDFGVGDIQAHYPKNKIPTPHLDRLVRQGTSFADAHSPSAVCSPTRYGLLTGRYAWRSRLQEWVIAAYEPPLIDRDRPTLPGLLRQHGYRTSCVGKWHLGWNWPGPQPSRMTEVRNGQKSLTWDFTKRIADGPTERGFDYYFGVDLPNLPPFTYIENDRVVVQPTEPFQVDPSQGVVLPRGFVGAPMAPGWRLDQILPELTRRAVEQIEASAKKEQPFFLFFSMTSPHEPVSPSAPFRGKSGIAPIADFVMETDWSAGQVIQAIDDAGIADQTLVLFTADNGHSHYTGWEKLVYKMSGQNLQQSRGLPTVAELYNLREDIGERENLSRQHPDVVQRMTRQLESVIAAGATRPGLNQANDTDVRFDTIQSLRWAPAKETN